MHTLHTLLHRYRHQHGHQHGHRHQPTQPAAPATEGRLIRWARLYDPLVWLVSMGQTRTLRALPLDLAALLPGEGVSVAMEQKTGIRNEAKVSRRLTNLTQWHNNCSLVPIQDRSGSAGANKVKVLGLVCSFAVLPIFES